MKTNKISIQICLFIIWASISLSGCSKINSFGLVFSAIDPNTGNTGIYEYKNTDRSITQIDSSPEFDLYIFQTVYVSKDGENIYAEHFSRDTVNLDAGNRKIALYLSEKGGPFREIFYMDKGIERVSFSPDGSHIVVQDNDDILWIGEINGQIVENLQLVRTSNNANKIFTEISWSPDNNSITFAQRIDPSSITDYVKSAVYSEVYTLDISTLQMKMLADYTMGCINPLWSASGEWIAMQCVSEKDPVPKIILISPDGKRANKIECPQKEEEYSFSSIFSLSPDGIKLAYVCYIESNAYLYYTMLDQIEQKNIPISVIENVTTIKDIFWAPDSKNIIFIADSMQNSHTEPNKDQYQIVITDLDGSDQQIISNQYENYQDLYVYEISSDK